MKKLFCLALAFILILGLCACSGDSDAGKEGLQVGFARVDVTPDDPVNLAGGDSANRISTGYRDPITVSCTALGYGEDTYLIYTMDYISATSAYTAKAESAVTEATGISGDRMIMNAVHTHSAPAIGDNFDSILPYREKFNKAMVKAAKEAIADMASAQVFSGACDTEETAFVRHYEMEDGTLASVNYSSFNGTIKGYAYKGDDQVQVIRFVRADESKKDIVFISNPAHGTAVNTTDRYLLSADIAHSTREYVEKNADCHVAYFVGAAGDQAPNSKIPSEKLSDDYIAYGQRLGKQVMTLLGSLSQNTAGAISLKTQSFTGNSMKEGLDRLQDAQSVMATIREHGYNATQTQNAVARYGFESPYEVAAIVERSALEDTQTMTLNAMSVGDLAFVFAPYEMFSENGTFIKTNSPYSMTFLITCSEDHQGYLPSATGFRLGCYETQMTYYAQGTAEDVASAYMDMLKALKNG